MFVMLTHASDVGPGTEILLLEPINVAYQNCYSPLRIHQNVVWRADKTSSWLGKLPRTMEAYLMAVKQVKWLSSRFVRP